jgi:hypothetical protein
MGERLFGPGRLTDDHFVVETCWKSYLIFDETPAPFCTYVAGANRGVVSPSAPFILSGGAVIAFSGNRLRIRVPVWISGYATRAAGSFAAWHLERPRRRAQTLNPVPSWRPVPSVPGFPTSRHSAYTTRIVTKLQRSVASNRRVCDVAGITLHARREMLATTVANRRSTVRPSASAAATLSGSYRVEDEAVPTGC